MLVLILLEVTQDSLEGRLIVLSPTKPLGELNINHSFQSYHKTPDTGEGEGQPISKCPVVTDMFPPTE